MLFFSFLCIFLSFFVYSLQVTIFNKFVRNLFLPDIHDLKSWVKFRQNMLMGSGKKKSWKIPEIPISHNGGNFKNSSLYWNSSEVTHIHWRPVLGQCLPLKKFDLNGWICSNIYVGTYWYVLHVLSDCEIKLRANIHIFTWKITKISKMLICL